MPPHEPEIVRGARLSFSELTEDYQGTVLGKSRLDLAVVVLGQFGKVAGWSGPFFKKTFAYKWFLGVVKIAIPLAYKNGFSRFICILCLPKNSKL